MINSMALLFTISGLPMVTFNFSSNFIISAWLMVMFNFFSNSMLPYRLVRKSILLFICDFVFTVPFDTLSKEEWKNNKPLDHMEIPVMNNFQVFTDYVFDC